MRVEASSTRSVPNLKNSSKKLRLFYHMRRQQKGAGMNQEEGHHQKATRLILGFPAFRSVGSKFLCAISYPVIGFLLELPE